MHRGSAALIVVIASGCGFSGRESDTGGTVDGPPDRIDSRPGTVDATPGSPDAPFDARVDARVDAAMATCSGYAPLAGGSPAGATYLGVSVKVTWSTARGACQAGGGDLVVIDDQTEANAVATLVEDPSTSPFFWVGEFDPSNGTDNDWVTVRGGAPPFLNWGSMQPSGGTENCMLVDDQGPPNQFWDYSCGAPQVYVCECLP